MGSYELIRELGRGGMGVVFAARDLKLGRRVAIKFVLRSEREFLDRFLIEARATARCNHENIVVIHEVDEYAGLPFMVLEFLEGRTLEQMITERPLPPPRVMELMESVASALREAHDMGIVHRDLKLENILVTDTGSVKVLDFGIAKAFDSIAPAKPESVDEDQLPLNMTAAGAVIGTPLFMAPEQVTGATIDGRADLWAAGIVMYMLLSGHHPLGNEISRAELFSQLVTPGPLVDTTGTLPLVDPRIAAIVDKCLSKTLVDRFESAEDLLAAIRELRPGTATRALDAGECPFPGLVAFGEEEANRFFGRNAEIRTATARLRDTPLLAVIGASGSGKSSFIRAGLVPALRESEEAWAALVLRPGRDPMRRLAALVSRLEASPAGHDVDTDIELTRRALARLQAEPGYLGSVLRNHAERSHGKLLLFIDQFEELFTLVSAADERSAFAACLLGAADDEASPVRVVLSMRSDFVDRADEVPELMDSMMRGLMFLPSFGAAQLREALVEPLLLTEHRFESDAMVDQLVDELDTASSPLPLLQFAAAELWQHRDTKSRQLTEASYKAMGGIGGALAAHADRALREFSPTQQRLVRTVFQRLITAEGTRAMCDVDELLDMADDTTSMQNVIDHLVSARLIMIDSESETPTVEIVHESLISSWPVLQRWNDENREDVAFTAQLRVAAKQWHTKGRPQGLLWRDEALDDARRWRQRAPGQPLPANERAYIDAVFDLADRAERRRKRVIVAAFTGTVAVAAAALGAALWINAAEGSARDQARVAQSEAKRARAAESDVRRQIERVQAAQSKRKLAEAKATKESARAKKEADRAKKESDRADQADVVIRTGKESLADANKRLVLAVKDARRDRDRARNALKLAKTKTQEARAAEGNLRANQIKLNRLLKEKEARVRKLEAKLQQISTDL